MEEGGDLLRIRTRSGEHYSGALGDGAAAVILGTDATEPGVGWKAAARIEQARRPALVIYRPAASPP